MIVCKMFVAYKGRCHSLEGSVPRSHANYGEVGPLISQDYRDEEERERFRVVGGVWLSVTQTDRLSFLCW